MITSFANPRVAQAFVDYMATQGVILTIQQHNQSDVWLADESQAERVRAELARFLENPADPRYLAASWQAGHTGSGLHYRRYPFFAALRERAGPVTWVVMIACVVVFIAMQILGDQEVMLWLAWPFDPTLKFEFWRYFTHALMHFSLMHILFNLLWWWYLGGAVEKRLGSGKLIVITLISALLSGYVQQKFSGPWFGGLSGRKAAIAERIASHKIARSKVSVFLMAMSAGVFMAIYLPAIMVCSPMRMQQTPSRSMSLMKEATQSMIIPSRLRY